MPVAIPKKMYLYTNNPDISKHLIPSSLSKYSLYNLANVN